MASKVRERRLAVKGPEVRTSGDTLTLEGYASTTGESYDMGWYREMVAPGAFKRTLGQNPDVRLLINHDGIPLARTTSGTLELAEDDTGLLTRASLDGASPAVQSMRSAMERGDLDSMSFGFYVTEQDWSPDYDQRTIRAVDLNDGDVSVVTYPANPNTVAALRSRGLSSIEGVVSALRALEQRAAAPDQIAGVLHRALDYLAGVLPAVVEVAATEAVDDEAAARAAVLTDLERRRRVLALL